MTITSTLILFGSNALAIRDDAAFAASSKQSFSNLDDLGTEIEQPRYATLEPNMWKMDGSYKFMPAAPHVGWLGAALSGSNGVFSSAPTLTITFDDVHSTDGLTLYFGELTGDWATNIDVAFYDASNVLIYSYNYTPSAWSFATEQAVANFKKIIITVNSTNKGYRFARLIGIDFDASTRFTSADIQSATLREKISPVSVETPANSCDFSLLDDDGGFNIIAPSEFYSSLQNREPVDVYESIDGVSNYMGRFFVDEWEGKSANEASLKTFDGIGILDSLPIDKTVINPYDIFAGDFSVGEVIERILSYGTNFEYEIATALYDVDLYGWIRSKDSYRDVLCQLALAGGAYITCSRSKKILVKMLETPYEAVETKYDERDALLTWTGSWALWEQPSAYQTTLKSMRTSGGQVYPNAYFTFEFTGTGFIIHYGTDFGALYEPDQYGKFYVKIDDDAEIMIEASGVGGDITYHTWESQVLPNTAHTVTVYGWVDGAEDEGNSVIYFDAVTLKTSEAGTPDYTLTTANKGMESPITLKPLVTGVEVVAHNYVWDGVTAIQIYSATLAAGSYTIEFDALHSNYTATGATISEYGNDWVTITVASPGTVTITGRKYVDSQTVYGVYSESLPDGTQENVVRIENVPFIHPANAETIALRIFNYYQQRYLQKTRLYASAIIPGDLVAVDVTGGQVVGIVESMTTNLTGSCVQDVEIAGIAEAD